MENSSLDLDAVWGGGSDGSKDEASSGVGDCPTARAIMGVDVGSPIVTNGDFVA